jgi:hypothetical protein
VILHFNYEELNALKSGAHTFLEEEGGGAAPVLAPPESRARVEALMPRLSGDVSLASLHELRGVQVAVRAIIECLRAEMEAVVVGHHAADEGAVAAYFEFAHALTVGHRLEHMAAEMSGMIELVTGAPPTDAAARDFHFPD